MQAVLGLRTTRPFRPVHTVFPGLIEIESSPAKLQVQHKFRRHCPINFSKRTFGEAIKTNEDYTGGEFVSLGDLTMDIKKENSRYIYNDFSTYQHRADFKLICTQENLPIKCWYPGCRPLCRRARVCPVPCESSVSELARTKSLF